MIQKIHNPDVLTCLANLSNDEVFTPPDLANTMLDTLPKEIWQDENATFLDPCCKSGVFLREIAKRLIVGLKDKIPDEQQRIDHIFKNQLFGISITEMTGMLSRRSVYCSKHANGRYSVCTKFTDESGNIVFNEIKHTFKNGRCEFCGAAETEYGEKVRVNLESHAYQFIHTLNPTEIFNMKFDVIIGNPPYQLSFGIEGTNSSNAKSIYNLFISSAIKLSPTYICMITPSRWLTKTSQGIPEEWVDDMLQQNKFKIIHDFEDAGDCFPGVEIKGGVNYFLWEKSYEGKCAYYFHYAGNETIEYRNDYLDSTNAGVVIRNPRAYSIIEKIKVIEGDYFIQNDRNVSGIVSPKHFFDDGVSLTSNWSSFSLENDGFHTIKYYLNKNIHNRDYAWVADMQVPKNLAVKNLHKVYIPAAGGSGTDQIIVGKPFYGEPNSICSQTYLVIGYNRQYSEEECQNIIKYIKTKFFRFLVSIKKKTQNGPRGVYQFVPMQDFTVNSDIYWGQSVSDIDKQLYKKYNLTQEEIDFIESMIRPMEG